ncbi:MAG: 5-(carboxyamino)imidazole ribonucleotide mutase [Candidatus Latescibacteria bacterium]|nr:5-(carboxyamino)imidazole ribonucleotide mutase [Candidatus Latescibacterota bacterium]NIM21646.1 5-(carboxyamino)imidazole ribonucleotide mutase [Candidatus Latescibacterota bacterium]NIM64625.1 5-(carboxyamino)imidazole ribonucleotide mutase [Candidatus Latescibacterota bacterium]NIO01140.1 5-(carboxyamino)imidazole ribonucleotide mutase [Candidatus Latescibacterota bacterium]NIO27533.1 5-(carboxyamino)imidazole ribonucleotide mutase [Candidatus Latescibacterota bacterium]
MAADKPLVAVVMGSKSDEEHLKNLFLQLDSLGIPWEKRVLSAHRQPKKLSAYVKDAEQKGILLFIAAAGLSAALPGVLASLTLRPVIGIPVPAGPLQGVDALLAIVQMPGGVPVATVGLGSNGPQNAAHLAARILALGDEALSIKLREFRDAQESG